MSQDAKKTLSGNHPTRDYFKTIGWVLTLLYLFLILFALVSGQIIGFEYTFLVCFGVGILVTIVFATIISLNLLIIGVIKIVLYYRKIHKSLMPRHLTTG